VRLATHDDGGPLSLDELRGREPGGGNDAPSLF